MGIADSSLLSFLAKVRTWIVGDFGGISREFWMPDDSCKMCYECDSRFTFFNRRHHCRNCGRLFCSKCVESDSISCDDVERMKFCKFCFQVTGLNMMEYDRRADPPVQLQVFDSDDDKSSICRSFKSESSATLLEAQQGFSSPHTIVSSSTVDPLSPASLCCSVMRSDEEDAGQHLSNPSRELCQDISDLDAINSNVRQEFYSCKSVPSSSFGSQCLPSSLVKADESSRQTGGSPISCDALVSDISMGIPRSLQLKFEDLANDDECTENLSIYNNRCQEPLEPLDFENNDLLWIPPHPDHEGDDTEDSFFDEEDDNICEPGGIFSSSSFSSYIFAGKERSSEGQKEPLRAVVHGHFQALVSQLLRGEAIDTANEEEGRGWLDIVTSLSWQAANYVKPNTSKGGSMDPADYVKVKCVLSGCPRDSTLVKGVVCTKNIKHKRMSSQYRNPKLLLLGGSLEYLRVPNMLASFDTLLQQEIEHLKMTVAKVEAHRPNVLLVEKSVSSYAQEYLLKKEISLVLNVKRSVLERVARCTGANIVPSIDKLASAKLGHCESFRLERFFEACASTELSNKRSTKTLMFFEGCPKRLGCTVILRGASREELKKVKYVVQYAVFAAYHLSLETSFLADEGASLPKMAPKSSFVTSDELMDTDTSFIPNQVIPISCQKIESDRVVRNRNKLEIYKSSSCISAQYEEALQIKDCFPSLDYDSDPLSSIYPASSNSSSTPFGFPEATEDPSRSLWSGTSDPSMVPTNVKMHDKLELVVNTEVGEARSCRQTSTAYQQEEANKIDQNDISIEYFSSADNNQSILVSFSSRCVPKGTVCERSQLFRIRFYGSFDKPLGRFLQDDLFDQRSCRLCKEPAEAHVRCYIHQQGSLTISVKRLLSFKLSGERDGKIWMWHRCLKCARKDGVPPATRRVVMSDAAWGLSFGKFLELSFSNHATANRVATCGHSLQKDCLRYYGCGSMVAFFRYSPIEILSVNLPPPILEFNSQIQEVWVKSEAMEVSMKLELLHAEVYDALKNIERGMESVECDASRRNEFCSYINELRDKLEKKQAEYAVLLRTFDLETRKPGLPALNILQLNRLRFYLLIDSYMWDRQLLLLDSSLKTNSPIDRGDSSLPVNAILSKIRNWRSESFHKDGRLDFTLFSASLDNPGDLTEVDAMEGKLNAVIKTDSSMPCAEECREPEGCESEHMSDDGRLFNDQVFSELKTSESLLQSPCSSLSDKIDLAWTGTVQSVKDQSPYGSQVGGLEGKKTDGISKFNNEVGRRVMSPTRMYSFDSALKFQVKTRRLSSTATSMRLTAAKSFHSYGDSLAPSMLGNQPLSSPRVTQTLSFILGYMPVFISASIMVNEGFRLLLPRMGFNSTVIAVYDDEPTSIISYALCSREHENFITDKFDEQSYGENDGRREECRNVTIGPVTGAAFPLSSLHSSNPVDSDDIHSISAGCDEASSSKVSFFSDAKKSHHLSVSFIDESSPAGKVKFSVICYFAKQFDALRKKCCPNETDFLCSLSRCKRWSAQGGKSNVYFAKTFDERFIIKQVTKTELESFEEFAPQYFKYLMDSLRSGSPTCLAKVLGIYQVTVKPTKGGKDTKMDLMVMENLFFRRSTSRVYDLKGSVRSRYNTDTTGRNRVLLDLNLLEALRTKPIFLGSKAKRRLERAIWNDTSFLASAGVMDYSLLVGVDEECKELVVGIIDFMRQYTWDKHLETWVKASGILGGPKNEAPTVISPEQYKKRFRKAMTAYFLTVLDQWPS